MGDVQGALQALEPALTEPGADAQLLLRASDLAKRAGDVERADRYHARALELITPEQR